MGAGALAAIVFGGLFGLRWLVLTLTGGEEIERLSIDSTSAVLAVTVYVDKEEQTERMLERLKTVAGATVEGVEEAMGMSRVSRVSRGPSWPPPLPPMPPDRP